MIDCSKINCGALKSPDNDRDAAFEAIVGGNRSIPTEFSYVPFAPPVRNQGPHRTCAAHTGTALKEINLRRMGINIDLSPEFVYFHRNTRTLDGMCGRNVFQILHRIGTIPRDHNGDFENMSWRRLARLRRMARRYRIAHYARITTIGGLKQAIYEVGPCYLSLPLFSQDEYFWRPRGSDPPTEGHAVTVVGYNAEGFVLRNTWGENWAEGGYIVLPYSDWQYHIECWIAIDGFSNRDNKGKCQVL